MRPSSGVGQDRASEQIMSPPRIVTLRSDTARYWHVGDYFLTAYPTSSGWDVRVRDRAGPGIELLLDGHFATEEEAVGWCTRMAAVFAQDQTDD
jgi:hypothetical protein